MRRLLPLTAAALLVPAVVAGAVTGGRPPSQPYPHMTALYVDSEFACGGQLVAPDLVLTAAHCVVDDDDRALRAGRVQLDTGAITAPRFAPSSAVPAAGLEVHADYDPSTSRNDVALLRLAAPARRGAPIALADPAADRPLWEPGDEVRLIGFGSRVPDRGVTAGGPLQEVDIEVQPDDRCSSVHGEGYDPATMLCAGRETGVQDACQGDSGGPLMARRADGALVLVGTVSFGILCGLPGSPGVYARVGAGPLHAWVSERLPRSAAPGGTGGGTPPGSPAGGGPSGGGASGGGGPSGGDPEAAPGDARPAVRLRSTRLALRRDGRVAVRLACRAGRTCRGSVTLTRGGRRAGRSTYRIAAGRTRTVGVRVAKRFRRARAVRVRVTVAGGRTATRVLRMRR